jgi:hypothetical protein
MSNFDNAIDFLELESKRAIPVERAWLRNRSAPPFEK